MKRILSIILLCATLTSGCDVFGQVNWQTIEQASKVDLTKNKKMFFVDFATSWCGWCKRMDRESFSDPVVSAILNKYYIPVKFDAEGSSTFTWNGKKYSNPQVAGQKPQVHPFTRAMLGKSIGFPSFVFLTKDGTLHKIEQGYLDAYNLSVLLWYYCSGDSRSYTYEEYVRVFQEEIKPEMMKKLGLGK